MPLWYRCVTPVLFKAERRMEVCSKLLTGIVGSLDSLKQSKELESFLASPVVKPQAKKIFLTRPLVENCMTIPCGFSNC